MKEYDNYDIQVSIENYNEIMTLEKTNIDGSKLYRRDNFNWKYIIIENNKTLFKYERQTEFEKIRRNKDKSTSVKLDNRRWILLEKDKTLFEYKGQTEFFSISRHNNGYTDIKLKNGKFITIN